ncbi:MAG: threonine-phosphate decarboxylase CobD [Halothiobacillaceae bacterium]|nr:threonine-phosphate decarboxylase CobD [Halothiobacillaceae bacterium]
MPEHGGRLRDAARAYNIPLKQWLDLSTGINPGGWPVGNLPAETWQRLPEDDDDLEQAARAYYACESLLPVAGSQAAIQALPGLRPACRVGVLSPGYAEHAHAWRRAGHAVQELSTHAIDPVLDTLDVLILIQPNNPTGHIFATEQLLAWHERLATRAGWLLVDEAFIDATPHLSLSRHLPRNGLILLRSLGKFFGLAGARVGFVLAEDALLDALREHLGPWTLVHPSRYVARLALADTAWQRATREHLAQASTRLATVLSAHGLAPQGSTALFQWVCHPRADMLHQALAQRGILTRLFADPASLRFGLPAHEADWQRLAHALTEIAPCAP